MIENILNEIKSKRTSLKMPWEIIFDIFLYMMTLSSGFFYIHFWFIESKIYCVPAQVTKKPWPTPLGAYVSSRCRTEYQIALLIYFPFCSLLSLIVLFTTHNLWKELPFVKRKIEIFNDICKQISQTQQYILIEKNNFVKNLTFDKNKSDKIKVII